MVSAFFNISRAISARANWARKCLFSCSKASLPAGRAACAPYPAPKQGLAHAQRLSYPRCGLPILVYAADRLGPKGRIILGSLPFTGWFFCFHDRGKLLSPCPFLPDHLSGLMAGLRGPDAGLDPASSRPRQVSLARGSG